jgi:hypothetical protein
LTHVDDAGASSSTQAVIAELPVDQSEHTHHKRIFDYQDPAPALINQSGDVFAMHFEWYPSQDFQVLHSRYGAIFGPEGMQMVLEEFQRYWCKGKGKGTELSQDDWETKFLRQLQHAYKNMRPVAGATGTNGAQTTRQQKRAAVTEAIMDINDTDW